MATLLIVGEVAKGSDPTCPAYPVSALAKKMEEGGYRRCKGAAHREHKEYRKPSRCCDIAARLEVVRSIEPQLHLERALSLYVDSKGSKLSGAYHFQLSCKSGLEGASSVLR